MNRLIYIIAGILACNLYTSCQQNEIELYNQTPRINFETRQRILELGDTDYVNKKTFITDSFTVRIQGNLLKEQKTFCLKSAKNEKYEETVEVKLDQSYAYTMLDTVCQTFYYKVACPPLKPGVSAYGSALEFDLGNPLHQFEKGKIEQHILPIMVRWQIKPKGWDEWLWLAYSDAKYKFMMDVCGCVYADMDDGAQPKVVEAYKQYKAEGNPPIVDQNGLEITFEE